MKIKLEIAFQGQVKKELSLDVDEAGPIVEAMHHIWDEGAAISRVAIGDSVIANDALMRVARLPEERDRRETGGQAAIAVSLDVSFTRRNLCPNSEPSVPL